MPLIHPNALVDPAAELADDVEIGPYTIVEPGARIAAGCRIGAHATLGSGLRLAANVRVHNYACLGTRSQDLKHDGAPSFAEIGAGAIVREFVTVNCGTRPSSVTRVGAGCVLMAYTHVAHECDLGERVILVNAATLGGEVTIGRGAVIGGLVGVHQFCRIGEYAMIGASSKVTQDIAPYLLADGHPARPHGPNLVGLRRAGFDDEQIKEIRRIYRELFRRERTWQGNLGMVEQRFGNSCHGPEILTFCRTTTRGIARPRHRKPEVTTSDGQDELGTMNDA